MVQPVKPVQARSWGSRARRFVGFFGFLVGVLALTEFVGVTPSSANLPVIDVTAITQMIAQTLQMAKQFEAMVQQVELLKSQVTSLTGHYGLGALGQAVNPWGNTSWQDMVTMVNSGVNPGDAAAVAAFKLARDRIQQANPVLAPELVPQNTRMNAVYSGTYQEAIAGMGLGEQSFNAVQGHLNDLAVYKNQIDQTDNVKAAIDLNTAVSIKAAEMNAENMRMNAAQVHMQASSKNNETNGQAAQAEFFSE